MWVYANIKLQIPMRSNQKNYQKQKYTFRKSRKRIEILFSQLCDQFKIRNNYAKSFNGFKTRILSKITALTFIQFVNVFVFNREMNKNTDVPQALQAANDWLLISCYTGQRFSDFMGIEAKQLKNTKGTICLLFIQQKILLPLHPTVINKLTKNGEIFPQLMDIQHYKSKIIEIARLACINETVNARRRFGFRSHDVEMEK